MIHERTIGELDHDELDSVAGGRTNGETAIFSAFYIGLYGALNQEGRNMLQDSFLEAQRRRAGEPDAVS